MPGQPSSKDSLGTLLRELRQSNSRTLDQVASIVSRAAGTIVSRDQVRSWETGKQNPTAADLGHLAIALEVPVMLLESALTTQQAEAKRTTENVNSAEDYGIGARVRQIRHWRGLSQKAVAELAGVNHTCLSQIENGYRAVTRRSLLEAIADALRVSPSDLTDKRWERTGGGEAAAAQAAFAAVADALDGHDLGEDSDVPHPREWPEVEAAVGRLVELAHVRADFVAAAGLIPAVLGDLHATYVRQPELRAPALRRLIACYRAAGSVTERFGHDGNGHTLLAAKAAQQCAGELDSPQWRGLTAWIRAHSGIPNRPRQYQRVVRAAEELVPALDDDEAAQAYGLLHLSAAMAAAAQSDRDTANTHLDEAQAVADRLDEEVGAFGTAWFGRTNVAIWRVSIGVELGDGAGVAEIARDVRVTNIPSPSRQANYFADLGRALLSERPTRTQGLKCLLRAEKLAPQLVRNDVFARETVGDTLRTARREAGGAELRGLAYRMGLAPGR